MTTTTESVVGIDPVSGAEIIQAGECFHELAALRFARSVMAEWDADYNTPAGHPESSAESFSLVIQSVLAWAWASGVDTEALISTIQDPGENRFWTRLVAVRGDRS